MKLEKPADLLPCPFCGVELVQRWNVFNPRAQCKTPGCYGMRLPVLSLDVPQDVAAWNTRAPAPMPMRGVPLKKLNELLAEGWELDGFGIRRTSGNTMRHGLVTQGGRVLWWQGGAAS